MPITRIVSGGQTGVDRAALDVALVLGIPHGGWVPRGRLDENGERLGSRYLVRETATADVSVRTELNVRDSDATLVISNGVLDEGSRLTMEKTLEYGRPFLHVDLSEMTLHQAAGTVSRWIVSTGCRVLNVAGPRAGRSPGIYELARCLLLALLA
jgi:hypothetical protein